MLLPSLTTMIALCTLLLSDPQVEPVATDFTPPAPWVVTQILYQPQVFIRCPSLGTPCIITSQLRLTVQAESIPSDTLPRLPPTCSAPEPATSAAQDRESLR
jgi:hypothetical protein